MDVGALLYFLNGNLNIFSGFSLATVRLSAMPLLYDNLNFVWRKDLITKLVAETSAEAPLNPQLK